MPQTLPQNKDLREMVRHLAPGFDLERDGRGHLTLLKDGEAVRDAGGKPIKLPSTTVSNRTITSTRKALEAAGALTNGSPKRETKTHRKDQQLALDRSDAELRGEERIKLTQQFHKRLDPLLAKAGQVRPSDLARVASYVNEDWNIDSAVTTTGQYLAGKALSEPELSRMLPLVERLEKAKDGARAEWFMLLRETLGLDQPQLTGGREWPFTVKLIPLEKVFAHFVEDGGYQRPVEENFVRDLVLKFDERLVGTIDVSERKGEGFAVIDGQQRSEAMRRVGKTTCYASVYADLSVADEATLFFHKNRDRKQVHPYYEFMARVTAGDPVNIDIKRIVEGEGFQLHLAGGAGLPQYAGTRDRNITAIRAVEEVYAYETDVRKECLTPTLSVVFRNFFGRKDSLSVNIIRGLGRFFRMFSDEEIQWTTWEEQIAAHGPTQILGMADDLHLAGSRAGNKNRAIGVSLAFVEIHNRGLPRGQRLDPRLVRSWQGPPKQTWRQWKAPQA